jgi:hypothetical protein
MGLQRVSLLHMARMLTGKPYDRVSGDHGGMPFGSGWSFRDRRRAFALNTANDIRFGSGWANAIPKVTISRKGFSIPLWGRHPNLVFGPLTALKTEVPAGVRDMGDHLNGLRVELGVRLFDQINVLAPEPHFAKNRVFSDPIAVATIYRPSSPDGHAFAFDEGMTNFFIARWPD